MTFIWIVKVIFKVKLKVKGRGTGYRPKIMSAALPPGGKKAYLDFGRKLVFDIIIFAVTSCIFW